MIRWCLLMLLCSGSALAQDLPPVESAPNEPPYTTPADEFGQQEEAPAVVPAETAEITPVLQKNGESRHFIHHPLSKKGLKLIDRDGSYYYATELKSSRDQTSTLRVGAIQPPQIVAADGTTNYQSMYGSANPVVAMYDYEWKPFKAFGALGLQIGAGFFTSQGQGRFQSPPATAPDGVAREKYTFYAIPLSLGGVYRFQYTDGQWIAPYAAGGVTYFAMIEDRDDGKSTNFVGTPAAYGAGGLLLNISAMNRETRYTLDAEYGIHTLWLSLEARQVQSSNQDLDFSGTMFSLGITADY